MRVLELAIDPESILETLADIIGLTLFEMEVALAWLAISFGFALLMAAIYRVSQRRSPVGRLTSSRKHFGGV